MATASWLTDKESNSRMSLSFYVTDIEGSVLSRADTLGLGLELASDKLQKKLPNSAKAVISQADTSDLFDTSKKT